MELHQEIMNKAYESYKDVGYDEFIEKLTKVQQLAVLTGNLNYQVENGGFSQWEFNGYSSQIDRLINLLKEFGEDTVTFSQIIDTLEEFKEEKEIYDSEREEFEKGNYEDMDEYDFDDMYGISYDTLDHRYYSLNKLFLKEVERVLKGNNKG